MEKYFIVTEESRLHKDWFGYKANSEAVRKVYNKFISENGIEASEYYPDTDALYIVPSDKDAEMFKTMLGAPLENGLRKFKASSKINKAWIKALEDAGLRVLRKPMLIMYLKVGGGKFRSRMFDQNGVLYCSIEPFHGETPNGFIEMKASEFFKVIEDSEKVPA